MCVSFNRHPPLGVNATGQDLSLEDHIGRSCFNGHPPLGVNATGGLCKHSLMVYAWQFQWAPTLGGECYRWTRG